MLEPASGEPWHRPQYPEMSVLKTRLKAREGAAATKSWNARIAVCSMNGLANWNDVTDFDVIPVITSADASAAVAARL